MTNYFYVKDGKIIGCGQAEMLDDDVINAEVSEDMVDYRDDWSWEADRFKWKYKWDGEKLIENPDFETEETAHYNEAMRQERLGAYNESDTLVARKIRKQSINDWTEEDEAEFIEAMTSITNKVKEQYPYK